MSARTVIAKILARHHVEELAERERMDRYWRVCAATARRRIHTETCHKPECLDGGPCARMTALGMTDEGGPPTKAQAAPVWCSDARWEQMQGSRRAGQAAVPIPRWQEYRPENSRGPGEDSGGTAAALATVAGRKGQERR